MSKPITERTLTWVDPSSGPQADPISLTGDRYFDLGLIAFGGMSEVRRVHDRLLDCVVAMKLLAVDRTDSEGARRRFIAEATATARLRHPGIVAVHDRGERTDGRLWYTMTEVRGETLAALLSDQTQTGASARRLLGVLGRVCEAVGYAHSQGVVHRDLKPDNLMVGPFGEVLVMDWGIAASVGAPGDRAGTPGWSAPEQLDGAAADPTADVAAIGKLLAVVAPPGDPTLQALIDAATREDPAARPADANAVAAQLQDWLDGAQRTVEADRILAEAMRTRPRIAQLRTMQLALAAEAQSILERVGADDPVEQKEPAWALEDRSVACGSEAAVLEAGWLQQVGAALQRDPSHDGAHRALADHHAAELVRAEGERRHHDALQHEVHLRRHDRGDHAALLRGDGAVTLITEPPGAEVQLFRYTERNRMLVAEPQGSLGTTPLHDCSLPRGSWLLELHLEGHAPVKYPVFLGRGEGWDGVPPGGDAPQPIRLPTADALGPDECLVPAGWFWCGGDPDAIEAFPRTRVWVDRFVVRRFPVTVGEFRAFLDHVARTDPQRALALGPHRTAIAGGGPMAQWTGSALVLDLADRLPIASITWEGAQAYAQWLAQTTGVAWRLMDEVEWEKAARGVDGRLFVTGDHLEPRRFNVLDGSSAAVQMEPVGSRPLDCSVYGVRDLVGNAATWCANGWRDSAAIQDSPPDAALRVVRGGSNRSSERALRCASRGADRPDRRFETMGLHLARTPISTP